MDRSKGFRCDQQIKYDFVQSIRDYLKETNHNKNTTFYELDAYSRLVPFGSPSAATEAPFDAIMMYGNHPYAIELKDRDYEAQRIDPAVLEPHKLRSMKEILSASAMTPLYVFGYQQREDYFNLWKIDPYGEYEKGVITASRYTVIDGDKYEKEEYFLWNSGATRINRKRIDLDDE